MSVCLSVCLSQIKIKDRLKFFIFPVYDNWKKKEKKRVLFFYEKKGGGSMIKGQRLCWCEMRNKKLKYLWKYMYLTFFLLLLKCIPWFFLCFVLKLSFLHLKVKMLWKKRRGGGTISTCSVINKLLQLHMFC